MGTLALAFVFFLSVAVVSSCAGGYVSAAKDRSPFEGAVIGFLFGPLGVLIAALMPAVSRAPVRRRPDNRNRFSDRTPRPAAVADPDEDAAFGWLNDDPPTRSIRSKP